MSEAAVNEKLTLGNAMFEASWRGGKDHLTCNEGVTGSSPVEGSSPYFVRFLGGRGHRRGSSLHERRRAAELDVDAVFVTLLNVHHAAVLEGLDPAHWP